MFVYFNGDILPRTEVRISPDDRGFLFGDGIYEVMHVYQGHLFRPEDHMARLRHSLEALRLSGVDPAALRIAVESLIERNGLARAEASVYIQVTRGAAPQRRHAFPDPPVAPTVFASVTPLTPALEKQERGVRAILAPDIRWSRCDIKSISLIANVCASQQAAERGAEEAILVRDGRVTEGTHTSVAALLGGHLVTHPLGPFILDGVTRRVVLELAAHLNIPVEERPLSETELRHADEVLLMSTTSEIRPVIALEETPVGSGQPGPITRRIQRAFRDLVRSL